MISNIIYQATKADPPVAGGRSWVWRMSSHPAWTAGFPEILISPYIVLTSCIYQIRHVSNLFVGSLKEHCHAVWLIRR
jgi:hypothetical protein